MIHSSWRVEVQTFHLGRISYAFGSYHIGPCVLGYTEKRLTLLISIDKACKRDAGRYLVHWYIAGARNMVPYRG